MASKELVVVCDGVETGASLLPGITSQKADDTESTSKALVTQGAAEEFLDPNARTRIKVGDQLSFMREFWEALGYKMPEPTTDQKAILKHNVAWHSVMHRLVPAPLLSGDERIQAVERARVFPSSTLDNKYMGLTIYGDIYEQALANPLQPVYAGEKQFGLGYQTYDGRIVGRHEYIHTLLATGNAAQGDDGRVWCFPLIDLSSIGDEDVSVGKKELEIAVEPTLTPEALIALSLLRDISDPRSFSVGSKEGISNEALYKLEDGVPKALKGMVEVGRSFVIGQAYASCISGEVSQYHKGVRFFTGHTAVSGLMA